MPTGEIPTEDEYRIGQERLDLLCPGQYDVHSLPVEEVRLLALPYESLLDALQDARKDATRAQEEPLVAAGTRATGSTTDMRGESELKDDAILLDGETEENV